MPYLLDTNVLSEFRKSKRADASVIRWWTSQIVEDLYVSVMTIGEIQQGIARIALKDAAQAAALELWRLETLTTYHGQILPVTLPVAERWGTLCPRQPLPPIDALLAATAIEYGLTMVTRNVADFIRAGVQTLNPFV